jgi:hypothetical protein
LPEQGDAIGFSLLIEIQLRIEVAEPCAGYSVSPRRTLVADSGTEVHIAPLLEGMRGLSGEKIQRYLGAGSAAGG